METKKLNILFASIFAFVFLIGFASATITLTPSISTLSQSSGSFNIVVSSNMNETIDLIIPSVSDGSGKNIIFTLTPSQVSLNTVSGSSHTVAVNYVVNSDFTFDFAQDYNAILSATGSVSGVVTKSIPFETSKFCEYDNLGKLKASIDNIDVINEYGFGDSNEWYMFDEIQVDVLVQNNGNEDVNNIVVEWGLYDTQSNNWAIELNEENDFDLNSDDENTVTFTFTLNNKLDEKLKNLEKGDYILYVRATGEISEGTHDGDNTCSSDSDNSKLVIDKDFVILNNIQVPTTVQCNSEVQISADVWDIGSRDQNNVHVNVYNKELGIDQDVQIGDINSFESSDFNFNLQLPKEIQEKRYYLTLTVYDENNDVFENGNNDKSIFSVALNVQGSCSAPKASLTAVLESGGEAGKPMVVKATITNSGSKTSTYLLNAVGYTGWASSATLDKTSLTLDAEKSGDVLLTFNINKDALGTNLFNIEVLSGNELVVSQPVQVDITKKTFGITGNLFSGNNKYIWGIGIINLILIILIIVIAVRIARK
jgi:CARDB